MAVAGSQLVSLKLSMLVRRPKLLLLSRPGLGCCASAVSLSGQTFLGGGFGELPSRLGASAGGWLERDALECGLATLAVGVVGCLAFWGLRLLCSRDDVSAGVLQLAAFTGVLEILRPRYANIKLRLVLIFHQYLLAVLTMIA